MCIWLGKHMIRTSGFCAVAQPLTVLVQRHASKEVRTFGTNHSEWSYGVLFVPVRSHNAVTVVLIFSH